jgi:hypothetical protein
VTSSEDELERESPQAPPPAAVDLISVRLLAGVVVVVLALIVAVVAVGLARDNLDSTGVATVLSTLFSGIVVGALLKGGRDDRGGGAP